MRTRAERRFRNRTIYNRRAKLFFRTYLNTVPCTEEELPEFNYRCKITHRFWRPAETWKELQEKNPSMHLYKNTGTIWDHGYWSKYDRQRLNKQSRSNAKLDLRNGEEDIYERTNLK